MEPPKATASTPKGAGGSSPAVFLRLNVMKNRSDFLATAKGQKWGTKGFYLQALDRKDDDDSVRIGFTCSKKVGNAVHRNRAKRRLREIAYKILPEFSKAGWDYVLVGRAEKTESREFDKLLSDLQYALGKVHK